MLNITKSRPIYQRENNEKTINQFEFINTNVGTPTKKNLVIEKLMSENMEMNVLIDRAKLVLCDQFCKYHTNTIQSFVHDPQTTTSNKENFLVIPVILSAKNY